MAESSTLRDGPEDKKDGAGPGNACDYCRRLKMKCIGKDNPPCQRCRGSKKPCTFGMETIKTRAPAGNVTIDKRLQGLEDQMGWIQNTLQSMINNQVMGNVGSHPPQQGSIDMGMGMNMGLGNMGGGHGHEVKHEPGYGPQGYTPQLPPSHLSRQRYPPPQQMWAQDQNQPPPSTGNLLEYQSFQSPTHGQMSRASPQIDPSLTSISSQFSPHGSSRLSASHTPHQSHYSSHYSQPQARHSPPRPISRNFDSLDDSNDALPDIPLRSLASRLEVARLVADGHTVSTEDDENGNEDAPSRRRSFTPEFTGREIDAGGQSGQSSNVRPLKRARFESDASAQAGKSPSGKSRQPGLRNALPRQKGDLAKTFKDPVDMGLCGDEEGRKLVDLYFSHCHQFIPVYDPAVDTWDSLRHRSPFSVSVLMLVGKHVEDSGGETSALQLQCKDQAELIGKSTVFSPVAHIEAIQALMVLSCWGDTVWRPGHLAFSIAVDMGLYRCLPYLAETGMGAGKDAQSLEEERALVVGARVWIALYKLRYEMAYNHGRPVLMTDDDTLMFARKFLEHPLSNSTDSRLVASCELLALRVTLHQPLSYRPSVPIPDLENKLQDADRDVEDWFRYWDAYYESHGLPVGHFMRESLISQMCHAILYANMRVLHDVKDRKSAASLPEHRRRRAEDAVRAAQRLIDMTLRGKQYKSTFIYANHYQHVGVAFTARTLIRLASLFPDIVDLKQAGRDLEQLVRLLAQVPGFQTGQMIEEVLRRARRKQVLPPPSKPPSPRFGHQRLQGARSETFGMDQYNGGGQRERSLRGSGPNRSGGYQGERERERQHSGYSPEVGSVESLPMFDFSLAEELLAGPGGALPGAASQPVEPGIIDPLFDPNMWFSFFPNNLGSGQSAGESGAGGSGTQINAPEPFGYNGNGDAPLW